MGQGSRPGSPANPANLSNSQENTANAEKHGRIDANVHRCIWGVRGGKDVSFRSEFQRPIVTANPQPGLRTVPRGLGSRQERSLEDARPPALSSQALPRPLRSILRGGATSLAHKALLHLFCCKGHQNVWELLLNI